MNILIVILALCVAVSYTASDKALKDSWEGFKRDHGKKYRDSTEESKRLNIWKSNLAFVEKHNTEADIGLHTFKIEMNKFGDLTSDEFSKIYNGYNKKIYKRKKRNTLNSTVSIQVANLPSSVDWRTQGYVTNVKDQLSCGSCWAFSATGALEGQHFKATGKLVSLSEQNLVDCSSAQGNMGCNGGLEEYAFKYIRDNKGIDTQASYRYTGQVGKCAFNSSNVGATCTGYVYLKPKNETALQEAVANIGPISVAIDASRYSFQLYKSGIYNDSSCNPQNLNHAVLVVGYGSQIINNKTEDYWIVKNSWGTGWGINGYVWMSRNRNNSCGIASEALYPTV